MCSRGCNFFAFMKGVKIRTQLEFSISVLQYLVFISVIWYGGFEVSQGNLTGPELAAFFVGLMLLIDPIIMLSKMFNKLQIATVSCERIHEIADTPILIQNAENKKNIQENQVGGGDSIGKQNKK